MNKSKGLVTIPTDVDVVSGTLELMERWGADALRDCDGTDFPQELRDVDAKIYSTYYTTRKDNDWARQNPDEIQQMYLMTPFYTASGTSLSIHLMKGLYPDMLTPNTRDDIKRWWEVVDRTTGKVVSPTHWSYCEETGDVTIETVPFHEYTVSFLAYIMWDPVHMYNAVTNSWKGVEHQITFDVRQPKTHAFTMKRLRKFIEEHPYVNVLRFTTFFHQFTLVFDELAREKYVDWYGYSASVSPYILQQFEEEVGYPFRPEYIIDQGYYNNQYRIPSKEYQDFQAFQRREVAKIVREMVVFFYGRKAHVRLVSSGGGSWKRGRARARGMSAAVSYAAELDGPEERAAASAGRERVAGIGEAAGASAAGKAVVLRKGGSPAPCGACVMGICSKDSACLWREQAHRFYKGCFPCRIIAST